MRRLVFLSLLILFSTQMAQAEQSVTIGLMAELTGQFTRMGEDCRRGYQIAEQLYAKDGSIGSRKVRFLFADNQGTAKGGLTEFRRLIDVEKAQVVVTTRSPVGLAINPLSKRRKIPILGIVGHPVFVEQNEYAFRVWPSVDAEGRALAKQVLSRGGKKAAVISLEDDYFLAMRDGFRQELLAGGGEIEFSETVLPGDNDFASLLGKVKQQVDVFFVNLGPAQTGLCIKKLRELGFTQPVVSNFLIGTPDALANAGEAANGTCFVELDYQKPSYLKEIKQRFDGKGASPIGYSCYVGLATVLKVLAGDSSAEQSVYELLRKLEQVELSDGLIAFSGREVQFDLKIREIQQGTVPRH